MDTNELKQKIEGLLNECPERKDSAARAAESDTYNCYTWDDHSHIIKSYCYTQIDFYNLVAEGNAEKIAEFINGIAEEYKNSFLRKIENVNEWY
jgi:hypothetical protein